MNSIFKKFFIKIVLLTSAIVLVSATSLWILNAFLGESIKVNTKKEETNSSNFKNANTQTLWKTWVALSINLWVKHKQTSDIWWIRLYTDAINISELLNEKTKQIAEDNLLWVNMKFIKEYQNVLKTDFKTMIYSANDREAMLNSVVSQLQYRHNLAVEQMKYLLNQKSNFESEIRLRQSDITWIKTKISQDYNKKDSLETSENIKKYTEKQNEIIVANTYVIFINQMLNDYNILNNYTKNLLEVFTTNKDAIIKNAQVVIPSSGTELLKEYDLLVE